MQSDRRVRCGVAQAVLWAAIVDEVQDFDRMSSAFAVTSSSDFVLRFLVQCTERQCLISIFVRQRLQYSSVRCSSGRSTEFVFCSLQTAIYLQLQFSGQWRWGLVRDIPARLPYFGGENCCAGWQFFWGWGCWVGVP